MCLFGDASGDEVRVPLPDYDDGVWHGFVPGVGPGQAYGFRVRGPYDAARGLRCDPAKLLLDPYARALRGEVSYGPEVFDRRGSWRSTATTRRLPIPPLSLIPPVPPTLRMPPVPRMRRNGGPVIASRSGRVRFWCCAARGRRARPDNR